MLQLRCTIAQADIGTVRHVIQHNFSLCVGDDRRDVASATALIVAAGQYGSLGLTHRDEEDRVIETERRPLSN